MTPCFLIHVNSITLVLSLHQKSEGDLIPDSMLIKVTDSESGISFSKSGQVLLL